MSVSVYCGNCDHGPILLTCLEDGDKTRCTSCGVYMHDSITAEDFDEDYCHGCESGVDAAYAHSERCQQREMDRSRMQYMDYSGPEDDEDYCHGCESGVDASDAHSERCQQKEMWISRLQYMDYCGPVMARPPSESCKLPKVAKMSGIKNAKEEGATEFDLSGLGLTEIPSELKELSNYQKVSSENTNML